jgi:ribonuclease III
MSLTAEEALLAAVAERNLPVSNMTALCQALTHKSFVPENPLASNERLEFLGDSILGLVINEYLYATYPDRGEGQLAKAKALIVCKTALAEAATVLNLMPLIRLGRAEEAMGGRNRSSLIADAYEAIVAVIYQERGYDTAREFILTTLKPQMEAVEASRDWRDSKTVLQEIRQAKKQTTPVYRVVHEEGMPHDKTFTIDVLLDEKVVGTGMGKNKRDAQQAAAESALAKMK